MFLSSKDQIILVLKKVPFKNVQTDGDVAKEDQRLNLVLHV